MKVLHVTCIALLLLLLSCENESVEKPNNSKAESKEVVLYNWKEYTSLSVLKEFEAETGIKVILKEYETLDEQIATLQSNPRFCDLTVFDTHMAKKQFRPMKIIKSLDIAKLKNTTDYVSQFNDFRDVGIPYSFGITGYAVDTRKVKEDFTNYKFLLNPLYKSKLSLLDDPVDVYLSLILASGNDINKNPNPKSTKEIEDFTFALKGNDISFHETFTNLDLLVAGEKWIVQTYNGDAASYMEENDFIKFIFPKKNYNAWSEMICLTTNSPNEKNAYKLLNFLSRPKAAADFSNEFLYANGISGSDKFMNEDIKNNPLINLNNDTRSKGSFYFKSKEGNSSAQRIYSILSSSRDDVP